MPQVLLTTISGKSGSPHFPDGSVFAEISKPLVRKYGNDKKFTLLLGDSMVAEHDLIPEGAVVTVLMAVKDAKELEMEEWKRERDLRDELRRRKDEERNRKKRVEEEERRRKEEEEREKERALDLRVIGEGGAVSAGAEVISLGFMTTSAVGYGTVKETFCRWTCGKILRLDCATVQIEWGSRSRTHSLNALRFIALAEPQARSTHQKVARQSMPSDEACGSQAGCQRSNVMEDDLLATLARREAKRVRKERHNKMGPEYQEFQPSQF